MTLYELHEYIGEAIENGMGGHTVVFGDCNTMHKVGGIGEGFVEDIGEYYLTEIDPGDKEGVAVYVIGE